MPTQINFPSTGPWNMTRYFMWHEDAVFGDLDISSPAYTAWFGVNKIDVKSIVDYELFYEAGSGFTYYRAVDKAHNFEINVDFGVADIPVLQWATTLPNFGTPANTLAKARTFVVARKVNVAGTMTETFQLLRHFMPSALEMNLQESQLISGRMTLAGRLISTPTSTNPLTTPTFPALGSISLPMWRHIDAGNSAITHNAISYPITQMTARWDYGLAIDRVYGSDLVDAITLASLKASGSIVSKSFKDLVMRQYPEQATVGALQTNKYAVVAKLKSGSSKINYTDVVLTNLAEMLEFGGQTTSEESFDFEAPTAVIDAVG
ncbi:MAG TPA: hypothetical protein VL854_12985 [Nitrososphaeraceae archaeon]|nr:hypothetical protein [Nitrososphaeraceae archaeon]